MGRRSCFEGLRQPSPVVCGTGTRSAGRSGLMAPPPRAWAETLKVFAFSGFQHLLLIPRLPGLPPLRLWAWAPSSASHVSAITWRKEKTAKESSRKQERCHLMSAFFFSTWIIWLAPPLPATLTPSSKHTARRARSLARSLTHSLSSLRECRHTHTHTFSCSLDAAARQPPVRWSHVR